MLDRQWETEARPQNFKGKLGVPTNGQFPRVSDGGKFLERERNLPRCWRKSLEGRVGLPPKNLPPLADQIPTGL